MKFLTTLILLFFLFGCQYPGLRNLDSSKKINQPNYALLQKELQEIYDIDQKIRNINWDSINADPALQNAFALKMQKTDSSNQSRILPILEQYGWLPKSKIGEKASSAIYLVIQHSNLETIEKYLPQMEKLARKGEANARSAAIMRDRLLMFQGKKQLYGTQASNWVRDDGSMVIWPIANVKEVNKLRMKVGFNTTVEENAKRLGAVYNPKEELPKKKNDTQQ